MAYNVGYKVRVYFGERFSSQTLEISKQRGLIIYSLFKLLTGLVTATFMV